MTEDAILEALDALSMLQSDDGLPRNIRARIQDIVSLLQNANMELPIKINKSLSELDLIAEDINLQAFIRTQVWNVSSILEKVH